MESWRWRWCCWVILALVQFHVNCCLGCWEQERIGLLEIKASMNHPNGTFLPYWDSNDRESDCCAWEGVRCNINTRRVIKLLLNETRRFVLANNWFLNASLFLPFEELRYLDLSFNSIAGVVVNEGFERLSMLDKLEVLNLGGNNLNNSILPSLGMLSSLKSLVLSDNNFNGSIHFGEFHKLSNLEELDLSYNYWIDSLAIKGPTSMTKLRVLNLRENSFNASIIQSLGALSSLKTLDIGGNKLQGLISGDGKIQL